MKPFNFINFQLYKLLTVVCFQLLTFNCFAQANQPGAGNCLQFNGSDNYVSVGPINTFFNGTNYIMTVEAWVNLNSAASGTQQSVVSKYNSNANLVTFLFGVAPSGSLIFQAFLSNSNSIYRQTATGIVPYNNWVHIAANVNLQTQEIILFVNGIIINGTTTIFGTPPTVFTNNTTNVKISSLTNISNNNDNLLRGLADEVRIWNTARTQTQIRDNMCKKLIGNEAGLVGYWRFDETSGNTAFDSSPNGNNGTGF